MPHQILVEMQDELEDAGRELVSAADIASYLERVLVEEDSGADVELAVVLAGPMFLRELNRDHRGADEPTDVLSFPASEGEPFPGQPDEPEYLGDIAVSVPTVVENARAAGIEPVLELRHVVVHGLLHLLGYDHETPEDDATMRAREEAVLGPEIHAGRDLDAHAGHD